MRPDEFQEKPEHGGNGMARDGIRFSPGLTVPHRSSRSTCQLPLPPSDSTQGIPGRVCRPHRGDKAWGKPLRTVSQTEDSAMRL